MRNDLTDITVVMDRSGSMYVCQADAEGGLNTFIEEQKKHPGEARFTLMQFDDRPEYIYQNKPIKEVLACALVPRGNTALNDAIGKAIVDTGERLRNMPEDQRPGLVVFVILTDGHENASREYTTAKIKEMIKHQRDVYRWQFTFLGTNQDAFDSADKIGITRDATLQYSEQKTSGGITASSDMVKRMRTQSLQGKEVVSRYTLEERTSAL